MPTTLVAGASLHKLFDLRPKSHSQKFLLRLSKCSQNESLVRNELAGGSLRHKKQKTEIKI
jgi:hypothetical protein